MTGASFKYAAFTALSRAMRLAGVPPSPKAGQRVLLYHSVGTKLPKDPYGLSIEPKRFEEHMDRLAELRAEWPPAPFGAPRPDRLEVAVVFDDGYRDALTTAAPILAARNIPFTVFVTPGFIRDGSPHHLTREQLKELATVAGAQIGAHGMRHIRLKKADDAAVSRELMDSRKFIEDVLGRPVTLMSYPHGSADRRVAGLVRAAGFTAAGTSRFGLNEPGRDPMLLCRNEILAVDTVELFELKLRGHWDWYRWRHRDPAGEATR